MIEKTVLTILVAASLLALGNAGITFQRSYYLEAGDRVNLSRLTDNVEQLDHARLVRLTEQLVTISDSDYGVLRLLNREFRRAILGLGICLSALLMFTLFLQIRKTWYRGPAMDDRS